jgi:hypothetical protein
MENFRKFIFGMLIIIASLWINAFFISCLWEWYVTPSFKVEVLTIIECMSIIVIKDIIFFKMPESDTSGAGELFENFFKIILVKGILVIIFYLMSLIYI